VNLGARLHAEPLAEPLAAPPAGTIWRTVFSTEDRAYGGWGAPEIATLDDGWWLPAASAALLSSCHG
jgi:maltooligosyltrehalose trehalohydrolase